MPATTATGPACAAVLAALRASATLTALVPVARITDQGPSSPPTSFYPFILVESHGEQPFNTLGAPTDTAFGSSVMLAVRVISQYRGDAEINNLTSIVRGILDGLLIAFGAFGPSMLTFEGTAPIFQTPVGGIPTREQVSEFDLTVHQ